MPIQSVSALEEIQFKPKFLLEDPLPLKDLEAFVKTGKASGDLQFLLDLIVSFGSLSEQEVQEFLGNPTKVNTQLVDRFLSSAMGEVLVQEVMDVMQPSGTDPNQWRELSAAISAASQDGQVSVLEVLQNYQPDLLEIDVQRVTNVQKRINSDLQAFQKILGIEVSGEFKKGVKDLFCTDDSNQTRPLLDLLTSFTTLQDEQVQDFFDQTFEIKSELVDRFLVSFFGEIFLKHLALAVKPNAPLQDTTEALQNAISVAGKDNSLSVQEMLEAYEPNDLETNSDTLTSIVGRVRDDVRDFQNILGLEGAEDVSAVVKELVCPEEVDR
jgi:hypothetical protein